MSTSIEYDTIPTLSVEPLLISAAVIVTDPVPTLGVTEIFWQIATGSSESNMFKLANGTVESAGGLCPCTQLETSSKLTSVTKTARLVASYSVLAGAEAGKPSTTNALKKILDGSSIDGMVPPETDDVPVKSTA